MPKDFLTLADWTAEDLLALLDRARELKQGLGRGERPQSLLGRALAMFFEKPSLRTHVTFEAGMAQLGGHAISLRPEQVGIGTREAPRDGALNLSRWGDGIVARTFSHALVEELAEVATIPVINGLTDLLHPCQVMADFQTIAERVELKDAVIAYVGDGNNVAHSLMYGGALTGMHVTVCCPPDYQPAQSVTTETTRIGKSTGADIAVTHDLPAVASGADVLYTDVWASMGQEDESEVRAEAFEGYVIDRKLMRLADEDAIFLHCLPAHRGEEVEAEVFEGPQSRVFDQAENRLHVQKALLAKLLG